MDNQGNTLKEEMIIQDIIKKYGDEINLKESPYLIIEIIRHYKNLVFDDPDGGPLPGGVPPTPPPGPSDFGDIRNADLLKEILVVNKEVSVMKEVVILVKELLLREKR